jgi:membrane protein
MAAQTKRLLDIARHVAKLRAKERGERDRMKRRGIWLLRWGWMLYHEMMRDNVKIRAESLAYLSLFSLLPLLAGCFFIFTVLAQFGMVQDALNGLLSTFLSNIPFEHREFVNEYVTRFQQSYLETIQQKSGTIGVFALLILAYVGLQAYTNIEHTMNDIWGSDVRRPFLEKAGNFIVIAVVAPITLIAAFSIPIILTKIPVTAFVLEKVPLVKVLLSTLIPITLLLGTFYVLYRYVPVVRVRWRAALYGAIFSTITLELTNIFLRIYFSFFANTAYGKLAAVPLIAFWLFVVWTIIILGAEVSFLVQNQVDILARADEAPTLSEARGLIAGLAFMHAQYQSGGGAVDWEVLSEKAVLAADNLRKIIEFSLKNHWIAEVVSEAGASDEHSYLPARDLAKLKVSEVLQAFMGVQDGKTRSSWSKEWDSSIDAWLESFGKLTIADLSSKNSVTNNK